MGFLTLFFLAFFIVHVLTHSKVSLWSNNQPKELRMKESFEQAAGTPSDNKALNAEDRLFSRLSTAVRNGDAENVAQLLRQGANINGRDSNGQTALHLAAAARARSCVRVLIKDAACDYTIRDNNGLFASDVAILHDDIAVGLLLSKKMAMQAYTRNISLWPEPVL